MPKKKDLTTKTESDLKKTIREKRLALRDFYFDLAGGKVTNVKKGKNIRKEIARIMTVWREKELITENK